MKAAVALLTLLFLPPAVAAGRYSGYYERFEVWYVIEDDRTLWVQENRVYVNTSRWTYKLIENKYVPSTEVENVRVWDPSGSLSFNVHPLENRTQIDFETRAISPGERYRYFLSYRASGLVSGTGLEYSLNFGSLAARETRYENYTLVIQGPPGTYPFLSKPSAELISTDPPAWRYSTSLQPDEEFGGLRTKFYHHPGFYRVELEYTVRNPSTTEITSFTLDTMVLNRGTGWQFSSVVSASPQPSTAYFDVDNNLHLVIPLGKIPPFQAKRVSLSLLYEVTIYDPGIGPEDIGEIFEVPPTHEGYLRPDNGWDSQAPEILAAAEQAVGRETNTYSAALGIHEYVVEALDYEIQEKRLGSLQALEIGRGDCSEYTDLSIALARAAGIPARAVYGRGYYERENLRGHAWVEFYLPGHGWVPADPTWAETSGDYFSRIDPIHMVRSVRGFISSESWFSYTYVGAKPEVEEDQQIFLISREASLPEYISAAEFHFQAASDLMRGVDNQQLSALLSAAETEMNLARDAGDRENVLLHAKRSITYSNEIIAALGEPPGVQGFEWNAVLIIAFVTVAVLVAGATGIVRKRRGSH